MAIVSGIFASATVSAPLTPDPGYIFNLHVSGNFNAVVVLERSFDGSDWLPFVPDKYTFLNPASVQVDECLIERESGIQYRLNCMSITFGTVSYRISQ